ncbi:MAG: transporter substrate-binding domain-containing protein [Selenomonadaceae bacterium]|nr:transporter substrate-binding domain-containing protein [Selenomonadaceae bacterium]
MTLRKIFAVMLMCIFSAAILTGCGEEKKVEAPATSEFKIGMLAHMNATEKNFDNFIQKISETFNFKMSSYDPIFFDNLSSMQMALESGQINAISTYKCVADYLIAKNPKLEIADNDALNFVDAFCFALREGDKDLIGMVNKAIVEMRDDGTLDELNKKYVANFKTNEEISAVEIQNISGANTIKVAVTGDLPPLDFIDAEGKAAGFNTAVLAELSRRIGRNIELVQIDSGARAAALNSGRVDIVFWAIVPVSEIIPSNADKPAGVELTTPYYRGRIVHVKMKK